MDTQPSGKFEVIDHQELSGRGAFVIGYIREGAVKVGDSVPLPDTSTVWTISGVEFLDNISERKYWNALLFKEHPARSDVEAAFPVRSYVDVYERQPEEQASPAGSGRSRSPRMPSIKSVERLLCRREAVIRVVSYLKGES